MFWLGRDPATEIFVPWPTFDPETLERLMTTPGCSSTSCVTSRPLSGIDASCCSVTTLEIVPVVVSTSGAAPATVIDSETLPSESRASTTGTISNVVTEQQL